MRVIPNYLKCRKMHSSKKILIAGGNGQLAQSLLHHQDASSFHLIPLTRKNLDITNQQSIEKVIQIHMPDWMINTAAYTAVDQAEIEIEKAHQVNHHGANYIAKACEKHDIPLLHISTDYVFDGLSNAPYSEEDAVNPLNIYGKSKWLGEEAIRQSHPKHIILRVSSIFSAFGQNFFKTMLHLKRSKKTIQVVADQITCPTFAGDIAKAIFTIISSPSIFGTYHFASTEFVSWHQFAEAILNQKVVAASSHNMMHLAKRPSFSALDCRKIQSTFGIKQPSWHKALTQLLENSVLSL